MKHIKFLIALVVLAFASPVSHAGQVNGFDSEGSNLTMPPVPIAGKDADGKVRSLKLNADGTLPGLGGGGSSGEVVVTSGTVNLTGAVPLPTGAATDSVLQSVRDRLPQTANNALLIGNSKNKLRDEFPAGGLNPDLWDTISTGAGMSISTGNGTTGSYLRIQSGTTANSETVIRSKESFTLPVRVAAFISASQRIANQEFFLELIEVDANGDPVTVAASQTNAGVWRNHTSTKFDGTTATNALVTARSGGAPEFVSAASTITTTAATGTDPNFFPAGYVELRVTGEDVALIQSAIDSTSGVTVARRITQAAPNPSVPYKLQLRARNLGTAPASSTDWRVHSFRLFDFTRLDVSVIGGTGYTAGALGAPVVATQAGTYQSVGAAAHDAVVSGNPVLIGGEARSTNGTAVASGDVVRLLQTLLGSPVTTPYSIPEQWRSFNQALTLTSDVQLAGAAGTGIKNHLTRFWALNTGASTVDLIVKDGTTERERFPLPVNVPVPVLFPTPMQITANAALNVALSAGGTVRLTGGYYIAP